MLVSEPDEGRGHVMTADQGLKLQLFMSMSKFVLVTFIQTQTGEEHQVENDQFNDVRIVADGTLQEQFPSSSKVIPRKVRLRGGINQAVHKL